MSLYHIPILLEEVIKGLSIKPDGVYVDMTYGSGGYAKAILERERRVKVIAFDMDRDALKNVVEDSRLKLFHSNYRFFNNFLDYLGIEKVDGIVADLGVSSYQFDTVERGFSFRYDTKLDLRMNTQSKIDGATVLNTYSSEQLAEMFYHYGEIKEARKLAHDVVLLRETKPIKTTGDFIEIIKKYVKKGKEYKFYAKAFQALRIEVNDELNALKEMLQKTLNYLKAGSRICIVSYHSLEDTIVKNFFKSGNVEGIINKDIKGNVIEEVFRIITKKPIVPEAEEIEKNNRARSAKLRIAEKL